MLFCSECELRLGSIPEHPPEQGGRKMNDYLKCMVPIVREYLAENGLHKLMAVTETELLLRSYELKSILDHLGYVNNSGHWSKPSALK